MTMESQDGLVAENSDRSLEPPPRETADDYIEYFIYIVDPLLTRFDRQELLRSIRSSSLQLSKKLLDDYIWHCEGFNLEHQHRNGLDSLYGRTIFADSVEDEWLIVYVLRELSRRFKKAWIRVADSDGEFLLIEAARALPTWINPEIADNRVWINQGHLLIVPKSAPSAHTSVDISKSLSRQQALQFLASSRESLLHLDAVEEEAFFRVKKYPEQIKRNLHCAQGLIPRELAFILRKTPAFIGPAVKAFYLRDPLNMYTLQKRGTDLVMFPPIDLVRCPIKFTRVGFAQVKSQRFGLPQTWIDSVVKQFDSNVNEAWAEIGAKVSCGFEILMSDTIYQDIKAVREIQLILEDIKNGDEELPSDEIAACWDSFEDDDSWLDINYEDFEQQLSSADARNDAKGFGDTNVHENLKKMVSRFEDFLKDDAAGLDGVDLDEMDEDEGKDSSEADSDDMAEKPENEEAGDELTELIRATLGMSSQTMREIMGTSASTGQLDETKGNGLESEDLDDHEEIERLGQAMERELRNAGTLDLHSDHVSDERQHLAENILKSFKSQEGGSGPTSNLLGMMGLSLPPDKEE